MVPIRASIGKELPRLIPSVTTTTVQQKLRAASASGERISLTAAATRTGDFSRNPRVGDTPSRRPRKALRTMTKHRAFAREQGQTMAEYAVVLTLITAATMGLLIAYSGGIANAIATIAGIF
jgi:Flp pilus assembly pilin Flp